MRFADQFDARFVLAFEDLKKNYRKVYCLFLIPLPKIQLIAKMPEMNKLQEKKIGNLVPRRTYNLFFFCITLYTTLNHMFVVVYAVLFIE